MSRDRTSGRGQANLLALAAALFALTTATVLAVGLANAALGSELREPAERRTAVTLSDRLVAADSPLTERRNVLDATALEGFDARSFRRAYPGIDGRSVRIALDGDPIVERGTPSGGTTIERLVLVERGQAHTSEPPFSGGNRIVLPRRTPRIDLEIRPPENVSVETVRANGRVVLHDPSGLRGEHSISVSTRETPTMTVVANATLTEGDVTVTVYPRETTKSRLAVTVDD